MQIEPRKIYPIVRNLEDPTDTDTHYVRAFVYKPDTDELLDTLSLVDKGGQRFVYNYEIPGDPGGQGYFLHIVVKVYDDSGYATESTRYERTQEEILVKEEKISLGGGGGADISYKKIQEIVKNELEKLPKPEPQKEINLKEVLIALAIAKKEIESKIPSFKDIEFPKQEKIDLNPVLKAIANIRIPEPESIDYNRLSFEFVNGIDEVKTLLDNLLKIVKEFENINKEELVKVKEDLARPLMMEFPKDMKVKRDIEKVESKRPSLPSDYFKKIGLVK